MADWRVLDGPFWTEIVGTTKLEDESGPVLIL